MKKNPLSVCAIILVAATMLTFFSPIAKAQAVSSAYKQLAGQACEMNSFSLLNDDYAPSAIVPDYPTSGGGIYAPNGGTLELTRTGWVNPVGDITLSRIVYFSRDMTSGLHVFYNGSTPLSEIKSWLISEGIDYGIAALTPALAVKLAKAFSLPSGSASIAGLSV
ncbi:MAG: hypothetical protein IKZ82_00130 [Clostridia bacterium]|nr:hypothetical protein [Clostridia bacterium]